MNLVADGRGPYLPLNGCMCQGGECESCNAVVEAFTGLQTSLAHTLRALEAHLDDDCVRAKVGHRDLLCPCSANEVKEARAALALADKVRA